MFVLWGQVKINDWIFNTMRWWCALQRGLGIGNNHRETIRWNIFFSYYPSIDVSGGCEITKRQPKKYNFNRTFSLTKHARRARWQFSFFFSFLQFCFVLCQCIDFFSQWEKSDVRHVNVIHYTMHVLFRVYIFFFLLLLLFFFLFSALSRRVRCSLIHRNTCLSSATLSVYVYVTQWEKCKPKWW